MIVSTRTALELQLSNSRITNFQIASRLRSRCLAGMKSVGVSRLTSMRWLLIVLLVAISAVSMSNGLLTNADCEAQVNGSVSYYACLAGPEHIVRPDITTFNVTVDPLNSTCGFTPQRSCTLVCISVIFALCVA